jgi:hypothetical protein
VKSTAWYVYRLYATSGLLLYVGKTYSTKDRFAQHSVTQPWWDQVCIEMTRIETYATEATALAAESYAIKTEHPKYNKVHNQRFRVPAVVRAEISRPRTKVVRQHESPPQPPIQKCIRDISGMIGRGYSLQDAARHVIKNTGDTDLVRSACEFLLERKISA